MLRSRKFHRVVAFSSGRSDEGSGGSGGGGGNGGFGGGGGGGDRRGEDDAWSGNCADAMLALAEVLCSHSLVNCI